MMRRVDNKLGTNSNASTLMYLVVGGLIFATIVIGLILSSTNVSANEEDSIVDDVSIAVDVSCTLSGTGMNSHVDSVPNGTHRTDIGTTTLKAFCNDDEGFAIYAIGFTGDSYTGTNHTKLVGTTNPNNVISTGVWSQSSTDSSWAMKLAATNGTFTPIIVGSTADTEKDSNTPDFSNYAAVPDTFTRVAYRNSGTDIGVTAEGSVLTTTYDAFVNTTQASDTYVGKVKYTLVHPSDEEPTTPQVTDAGKICYYPNGSNVVGSMGCQTVSTSATSATLLASNFSREGYGFAGWSTTFDYSDSTGFYGPQEYITFDAGTYTGSNPGLSLYATWVKSEGSFQDSTKVATVCNRLTQSGPNVTKTLNSVSALTDERDNETYAIAKLADGNCWMIENLRLENTAAHNTDGSLAQGYGGQFAGLATAENANFTATNSSATDPTEPNSLYYAGTQSGTATIDISQTNYAGYRMPRYNNSNTSSRASSPTDNTVAMYSYGNYYTWAAAMANTGYYNTTTVDENGYTPSEAANTSLCPSGWKLPYGRNSANSKGTTSGGFSYLDIQLGGTGANSSSSTTPTGEDMSKVWQSYPNNFLYSGYFNGSSARFRGSYGTYWSSTAYGIGIYASHYLYLNSTDVYPGTSNYVKYYGLSVRCLVAGS